MTETGAQSDLALVRRVLAGERETYAKLIERYAESIAAMAARHTAPENATEIAHEVFVKAYENLGSFKAEKPFEHWLRKIAVNQCREYWRKRQKRRESTLTPESPQELSKVEAAMNRESLERHEDFVRGKQAEELVGYAMQDLKAEDRLVLTLTHVDEYAAEEVAGMLGWSVSKVKVRAFRARQRMREALSRLF